MTERQNCMRVLQLAIAVLGCIAITALAQNPRPKDAAVAYRDNGGAPNGGGPNSTNYCSKVDPCAYVYTCPAERLNQLLNENNFCTIFSRTEVNCSQPARGNNGRRIDRAGV
jgi:hypothetical protein